MQYMHGNYLLATLHLSSCTHMFGPQLVCHTKWGTKVVLAISYSKLAFQISEIDFHFVQEKAQEYLAVVICSQRHLELESQTVKFKVQLGAY